MVNTSELSAALISARLMGHALPEFPGRVPDTPAAAYAVQYASTRAWDDAVIGFKVGGIPPMSRGAFPSGWLYGPVFRRQVYPVAAGDTASVPAIAGGMAAYEAEFVMTLSGLDRLDGPVESLGEARRYVSALNVGAEIAQSPFRGTNPLGAGAIISDFGVQGGVVMGPSVDVGILDDLANVRVSVSIDGDPIGDAAPNPGDNGPLGALRFLLNSLANYPEDISLPDTLLLSSGAITGVHQSRADTSAHINFHGLGDFTVALPARNPSTR